MANPYESPGVLNVGNAEPAGEPIAEFKLSVGERLIWIVCGFCFLCFGLQESLLFYQRAVAGTEANVLILLGFITLGCFFTVCGVVKVVSSRILASENGIETIQFWRRKFYRWDSIESMQIGNGFTLRRNDGKEVKFYLSIQKEAQTRLARIVAKHLP